MPKVSGMELSLFMLADISDGYFSTYPTRLYLLLIVFLGH